MKTALLVSCISIFSLNAVGQTFNEAQMMAISSSYTYEGDGEYDKAIAVLGSAGIPPGEYFLNLRSGWLHYLKQDYQKAVNGYKLALIAQARSVEAFVGLLNCYYVMKEDVQLQTTAKSLIEVDPANYTAQRYLILSDIGRKEYRKAEIRVLNALSLYPIDLQLNVSLAETYLQQSKKGEAGNLIRWLEAIYGNSNTQIATLRKALE